MLAIVVIGAVFCSVKFLVFLCKGGAFTQVARNATHLYLQIRNVYPRMPKYTAMYMALMMNSCRVRDRMPESLVRSLVKEAQGGGEPWLYVIIPYVEFWFSRVCRTTRYVVGADKKLDDALVDAVAEAARDIVEMGSTRYEDELRALPRSDVMSYVVQYDEFDIRP